MQPVRAGGNTGRTINRTAMERFSYFTIRIRRPSVEPGTENVAGVVEYLATGEKRTFETGTELLKLIGSWPATGSALDGAAN